MSTSDVSEKVKWGVMEVKNDEDGETDEIHVVHGKVDKEGNFSHFGHILHSTCDCQPRMEVDKMMPIFIHRHNA